MQWVCLWSWQSCSAQAKPSWWFAALVRTYLCTFGYDGCARGPSEGDSWDLLDLNRTLWFAVPLQPACGGCSNRFSVENLIVFIYQRGRGRNAERKDECTRIGDLSGWFVRALITPLGFDKLTDCPTYTHMHIGRYFCSQTKLFSVCIFYAECVTLPCVHGVCAWTECVKGSLWLCLGLFCIEDPPAARTA